MEFETPMITEINHIGPLTNEEIAALPDEELELYLIENGYDQAKQRSQKISK